MNDDLVAFLKARLDEDRDYADNLAELYGQMGSPINGSDAVKLHALLREVAIRVVREVTAKRAILALHGAIWEDGYPVCNTCCAGNPHPCSTLRILAAVYSDHPDYRQEWAPHGLTSPAS